VTGGYAGVGEELVKIFYSKNAIVYVAGRSKSKADAALDRIKKAHPSSKGRLEFLSLDLADLTTLKPAAEAFKAKESRLDTLTNNAGVMNTPPKSKTMQGHELQLGTNCLGPWLFTHHLLPVLQKTAAEAPKNSVRVTWAASLATW
jgi:NAD(P)-dependent dehydrogenase (short-subunit alcohol dehydrogenase family)